MTEDDLQTTSPSHIMTNRTSGMRSGAQNFSFESSTGFDIYNINKVTNQTFLHQ